jgi:cytochrome P450
VLAAANRDEAAIPNPDEFEVTRDHRAHVAFGSGARYCVGAPLVRASARALLEAVATGVTAIDLAGDPVWQRRGAQLRFLDSLPLRLTAAER